jgi:hypothetical protein
LIDKNIIDEEMAGNRSHGVQNPLIRDASGTELNVDHSQSLFMKPVCHFHIMTLIHL